MRSENVELAGWGIRLVAVILDVILVPLTLFIGYLVWWLIALGRSQTPGKQIVGIQAVRDNGELVGWVLMFVREFLVKGILFGFLYGLTLGILFLVDNLWPLWDTDNQTLHIKIVGTRIAHIQRR